MTVDTATNRPALDRKSPKPRSKEKALMQHYMAECSCTWDLIIDGTKAVVYCSPSSYAVTGYPPDMFTQNIGHLEKIIHPEDRDHSPATCTCMDKAKLYPTCEYRIITPTSEEKWIRAFMRKIQLDGIPMDSILVSNFDISSFRHEALQLAEENHSLNQENRELTHKIDDLLDDLNTSEERLKRRNQAIQQTNGELMEANKALKILARNLEIIKRETEKRLLKTIQAHIYPLIDELRRTNSISVIKMASEELQFKIGELCQTFSKGHKLDFVHHLSAAESKVAVLIKKGDSSKEIADKLEISEATVKTHRRNIRRKLNLQNARVNLANYLRHKWT
jgi:DNA-binding CsgD family transcriptional regulator